MILKSLYLYGGNNYSKLAAPFYFTFFAKLNSAFNDLGYLSETASNFKQIRTKNTKHYKYLLPSAGRPK